MLLAVLVSIVVGVMIVAVLNNIGCKRCRQADRINRGENLGLMIQEALMELRNGRRCISAFNLINNRLGIFRKTFQKDVNLVFMILSFTKDPELIETRDDILKVNINCLFLLFPVLQLCFELFDVPTT